MIERLSKFIDILGISVRKFELSIAASNGLIRKAIANKTDIQSKWITLIAENYPQLSLDWLLTGKGEMLKNSGEKLENDIKDSNFTTNSFAELTDEQIEKAIEEAVTKKLLEMYESGLIYSAASVKEQQQRIADLLNENAKLRLEIETLQQQLNKQASKQSPEQPSKPVR